MGGRRIAHDRPRSKGPGVCGISSPVRSRPYTLVHPLLFAAYAVVFLYAENVDLVRLDEMVPSLIVAVAGAALALCLTTLALRNVEAGAVLAGVLVLLFFFAYTP